MEPVESARVYVWVYTQVKRCVYILFVWYFLFSLCVHYTACTLFQIVNCIVLRCVLMCNTVTIPGFRLRTRTCNNPKPINTNEGCEGAKSEAVLCKGDKVCRVSWRSFFFFSKRIYVVECVRLASASTTEYKNDFVTARRTKYQFEIHTL